jgi:hypothetical protein
MIHQKQIKNYYNDFELDEFKEADDNESEDGTWNEDGLDFDLNILFFLSAIPP